MLPLSPPLQQLEQLVPHRRLVATPGQLGDLALQARLWLVRRLGPAGEVTAERIALILLVKWHRFPDPSAMTINGGPTMPAAPSGEADPLD